MKIFNFKSGVDFSTKVKWRMKRQRNPLFVTLQDKYEVKKFAEERGVKTAPLLYVTETPELIPFDSLPANYMIKANHGCGWNIICLESDLYIFSNGRHFVDNYGRLVKTKSTERHKISRDETVKICKSWLQQTHITKEWAYQEIHPKIVIEELLKTDEDQIPDDCRLYTFDGKVKAISVGSPIYRRYNRNVFFTPDWTRIELTKYKEKLPDEIPSKPHNLEEMIRTAENLSCNLDFVRVDLYCAQQGIVLGEMTIYPESGSRLSPSGCPDFNKWLGNQWEIGAVDSLLALYWGIPDQIKESLHGQRKKWIEKYAQST